MRVMLPADEVPAAASSSDPSGVSHPVHIVATNLCTNVGQWLTTARCPRSATNPRLQLWTKVDNPRTTNCHLTSTNAMLSTIHSPYYPYYSL